MEANGAALWLAMSEVMALCITAPVTGNIHLMIEGFLDYYCNTQVA
jgi:hypothetical protein